MMPHILVVFLPRPFQFIIYSPPIIRLYSLSHSVVNQITNSMHYCILYTIIPYVLFHPVNYHTLCTIIPYVLLHPIYYHNLCNIKFYVLLYPTSYHTQCTIIPYVLSYYQIPTFYGVCIKKLKLWYPVASVVVPCMLQTPKLVGYKYPITAKRTEDTDQVRLRCTLMTVNKTNSNVDTVQTEQLNVSR
jgi:hypothetical protein